VRHSHANQVYQAWAINLLLKARPGGTLLFGMPLFHVGSSLTQALATLSAGSCGKIRPTNRKILCVKTSNVGRVDKEPAFFRGVMFQVG
jgi:hypothetical protein